MFTWIHKHPSGLWAFSPFTLHLRGRPPQSMSTLLLKASAVQGEAAQQVLRPGLWFWFNVQCDLIQGTKLTVRCSQSFFLCIYQKYCVDLNPHQTKHIPLLKWYQFQEQKSQSIIRKLYWLQPVLAWAFIWQFSWMMKREKQHASSPGKLKAFCLLLILDFKQ